MYDYALAVLKRAQQAVDEELKKKVERGGMTAPELALNRQNALDISDAIQTLESIATEPEEGL